MKNLLAAILFALLPVVAGAQTTVLSGALGPDTPPPQGFSTFKIGGGGYIVQVFASNDGTTKTALPDTTSGWVWCAADTVWREIGTPSTSPGISFITALVALIVAPSDPNRLYYVDSQGYIYFSTDCGHTTQRFSSYQFPVGNQAHSGYSRFFGPKIAVHPTNPDILYVTNPWAGVYKTTAGSNPAATFTQVANVPLPVPYASVFTGIVTNKVGNVLTFSSVSGVANGYWITDVTDPLATSNGTQGVQVSSFTSTTITATGSIANVQIGDTIRVNDYYGIDGSAYYVAVVDDADNLYLAGGGWVPVKVSSGGTVTTLTGGPTTTPASIALVQDGSQIWLATRTCVDITCGDVYKFISSTWTQATPAGAGGPPVAVTVDQTSPTRVAIGYMGWPGLSISTNAGSSFTNYSFGGYAATDIPWLGQFEYWASSNIAIAGNEILAGVGVGVYTTDKTTIAPGFIWTSKTAAIEQLVVHQIVAGGTSTGPLFVVADRDVFINPTPTASGPYTSIQGGCLSFCGTSGEAWSADCSRSNLYDCVLWGDTVYLTSSGGRTWSALPYSPRNVYLTLAADVNPGDATMQFSPNAQGLSILTDSRWCYTTPAYCPNSEVSSVDVGTGVMSLAITAPGFIAAGTTVRFKNEQNIGGSSAISTPGNFVIFPQHSATYPFYYKNGEMKPVIICAAGCTGFDANGGATPANNTGWGFAFYFWGAKYVAADAVTPGKFYALNYRTAGAGGGCYVNTNGGEGDWTRAATTIPALSGAAQSGTSLQAVPGYAGYLLLNTFSDLSVNHGSLLLSIDGCATWTNKGGFFNYVNTYAVGKEAPGTSVPAVYVNGVALVGGQKGWWRSNDILSVTPTWTYLGDIDNFNTPTYSATYVMSGASLTRYGEFYSGSSGGLGGWVGYFP